MSKITMDGEWAYRCQPTEPVRILCTDRPGGYPVVSFGAEGVIHEHRPDGAYLFNDAFDLIPLQRPRAKVRGWVNVYPPSPIAQATVWFSRKDADRAADSARIACVWVQETDPPEGQA